MLEFTVLQRWEPQLRSLARIVVGFTFSLHGWQKWFGMFGGNPDALPQLLRVAGMIETIGGALIILGLGTRPVAFILCGQMAVAYFRTHAPLGAWPLMNGGNNGELAVFYCFFFLWLCAAGAGPLSLDKLLKRQT